jgi:hypothetical protein
MKRDWLVVVVAVVAAVVVIGTYALMQGQNAATRADLSRVTVERNALQAKADSNTANYRAVVAERNKLQEKVAKLSTRIGKLIAQPVQPAPAAAIVSTGAAAPAPSANTYSDGVYLVGTDMPAGRYKGDVTGGVSYWAIYSDPNGANIVANSLPSGPFYVEVRNGQYLDLRGVQIAQVE